MRRAVFLTFCLAGLLPSPATLWADDADAIARGKKALEGRAFLPDFWPLAAYENAWKQWQPPLKNAPESYDAAFREHYGLHPAPFENGRFPLGLRPGKQGKGVTIDCLLCHGGSILGKSYVGLGNATSDLQALFEDMERAAGRPGLLPHRFANVRGTNEAFAMTVFLMSLRKPDLSPHLVGGMLVPQPWKQRDDLCEDVPAWWHLKKKQTIYHTGSTSARSVRSLMQFMLDPGNSTADFDREEIVFRDIQAYLLSLAPPKYPFPVDRKLSAAGRELFGMHCAECHGSYGANGAYPNKIVALDKIGTDPTRSYGLSAKSSKFVEFYNASWFSQEKPGAFKASDTVGYQAPPLDGIWASAPYLHNGAVPTLYDMLNSRTRPKLFTRSYRTDVIAYDKTKVGWKVDIVGQVPKGLPALEMRKFYDTTQPGRGNGGHTFGDDLTEQERWAIIEYLKTL